MIAIDIHQKPCEKAFMGANNLYAGYIAGRAVGAYFKSHFGCKYDTFVSLESSAAGVVNDQRCTPSFTADVAAIGHHGRGYRRTLFVFDTSGGTPQIIYRRDLNRMTRALGVARQNWQLTGNM